MRELVLMPYYLTDTPTLTKDTKKTYMTIREVMLSV